jgi:predicted AAA+ superfamily ATPase
MIKRQLQTIIQDRFFKGKAILIFGPRQVGKTTLLKAIHKNDDQVLWLNGDEPDVQEFFDNYTSSRLQAYLGKSKYLIIDEAQRIENIGLKLKIIIDSIDDVQLIATGSSSFELANRVNEPLTGRKFEYKLLPISFAEMVDEHGLLAEKRLIPHRMVYGYYPEIINHPGNEKERLKLLSDSYLYKDVLIWEQINKPDKLTKLLQALAYQVGSQVSYNELAQLCGLDSKTIEKYILILEQAFIIFRLNSYSRNLRNELKMSKKIYFYDNGIRNALLANFNQIETREDKNALWENFLMSERLKQLRYAKRNTRMHFWRTKQQQEVDYVEVSGEEITGYEFKWNPKRNIRFSKTFTKNYSQNVYGIHRGNFREFVMPEENPGITSN